MPTSPFVNPSSYGGNMFDSKIDVKMTMGGNSGAGNTKKHKSNKRSRRSIRLMKTKEYTEEIKSYKRKIQIISKDPPSLEQERIDLEMSYDKDVKSCRDDECWERLKKLYDGKKTILTRYLPQIGGGIYHGFDGNAGGYDLSPYQNNYVPQTASNHAEQRIHPYSGGGRKARTRSRRGKHVVVVASRNRIRRRQRRQTPHRLNLKP